MKTPTKKTAFLIALSLLLAIAGVDAWADLSAGKAAYESGKYADALKEVQPVAESGDPEAQLLLGNMYAKGTGVEKNTTEAFVWYSKAADQGNSEAEIALSDMYRDGRGVDKDSAMSAYWQWKAAQAFALTAKDQLEAEVKKNYVTKGVDGKFKLPQVITTDQEGNISACMPEYPTAAKKGELEGTVKILVLVTPEGKAKDAILLHSSGWPPLDSATLSAFKACQYHPATRSDRPVESPMIIAYTWKLN